jgi:inorganic pyrophosphatase
MLSSDTPRGSRNKLKWDKTLGVLKLRHILTAGAVFPFDFGFVPGTYGADGDALDVLVLTDEPLFPLCLVQARLIEMLRIPAQTTRCRELGRIPVAYKFRICPT